MLYLLRRLLLVLLLGLAPAHAQPVDQPAITTPTKATPALWRATGPAGAIYLFGTIHLLPPALAWRTPAYEQALSVSNRLMLELDERNLNPAVLQPTILRLGLLPEDRSLRDELGDELYNQLSDAGAQVGVPEVTLRRMRPWLAAVSLSAIAATRMGLNPEAGVDRAILTQANALGLLVEGLETADEQFVHLSRLDGDAGRALVKQTVDDLRDARTLFDRLLVAWASGDPVLLEKELVDRAAEESPVINEELLIARNRNWLPKLRQRLLEPGTTFVAVGAGHLVGPDGLVAMLQAEGVKVEQIAP